MVDSLGASSGYGLFMDKLADFRDEGMSAAELYEWAQNNRLKLHHWFFSTDLKYYVRGGRISKAAGFFGGALNICPLLNMDSEGRLIPRTKVRTKKKVIQAIVDRMEEDACDGLDYSGKCYISYAACLDDAKEVARLVEERFPKLSGKVELYSIGTTIGSHTGPGTVALFFWGKEGMIKRQLVYDNNHKTGCRFKFYRLFDLLCFKLERFTVSTLYHSRVSFVSSNLNFV